MLPTKGRENYVCTSSRAPENLKQELKCLIMDATEEECIKLLFTLNNLRENHSNPY